MLILIADNKLVNSYHAVEGSSVDCRCNQNPAGLKECSGIIVDMTRNCFPFAGIPEICIELLVTAWERKKN